MTTMIITIERAPRTLQFEGTVIEFEELSVSLPFARKPADHSEVGGEGNYKVFVTETWEMTPAEFDGFACQLLKSRDWLNGKGGYLADGRLCVEVRAIGRPTLYVDPSGGDYGRYVARLG
jgi:hypothetical protein